LHKSNLEVKNMAEEIIGTIEEIEAKAEKVLEDAMAKAAAAILASKAKIGEIQSEALPVGDVKKECEQIVDGAEKQADKIIEEAKKKAEDIKKAVAKKVDKIVTKVANTIVGLE